MKASGPQTKKKSLRPTGKEGKFIRVNDRHIHVFLHPKEKARRGSEKVGRVMELGEHVSCSSVLQCLSERVARPTDHRAWPRVTACQHLASIVSAMSEDPESTQTLMSGLLTPGLKLQGEMSLEFCFLACSSQTYSGLDKKFLCAKVMLIVLIL